MTNLLMNFDEAAAIDEVAAQVEQFRAKMTAASSRELLERHLSDLLWQGLVDELQIVKDAKNGDEVADAALRKVYAEWINSRREPKPPIHLESYALEALDHDKVKRPRGRATWHDNWRRDIGIAVLVFFAVCRFGLKPTRNPEQEPRSTVGL